MPSPDSVGVLLYQGHVAESQHGLTKRFFWCHSAIEIVAPLSLDVIADVLVEAVRCPSGALHGFISAARQDEGFARRLPQGCPICWFRSGVVSGLSRSVDRTWRAGCSLRCPRRT